MWPLAGSGCPDPGTWGVELWIYHSWKFDLPMQLPQGLSGTQEGWSKEAPIPTIVSSGGPGMGSSCQRASIALIHWFQNICTLTYWDCPISVGPCIQVVQQNPTCAIKWHQCLVYTCGRKPLQRKRTELGSIFNFTQSIREEEHRQMPLLKERKQMGIDEGKWEWNRFQEGTNSKKREMIYKWKEAQQKGP